MRFGVSDEEALMSNVFLLTVRQMARIVPIFLRAHGVLRVDDRRVSAASSMWLNFLRHCVLFRRTRQCARLELGPCPRAR